MWKQIWKFDNNEKLRFPNNLQNIVHIQMLWYLNGLLWMCYSFDQNNNTQLKTTHQKTKVHHNIILKFS